MAGTVITDVINTSSGIQSTNNALLGAAKAWVKFTGSSGATVASYNVSSVTRNSTGSFTINFTTSLADGNYVPVFSGSGGGSAGTQAWGYVNTGITQAAGSFGIFYQNMGAAGATYTNVDPTSGFVAVLGNG